jgi:hypothetical protein
MDPFGVQNHRSSGSNNIQLNYGNSNSRRRSGGNTGGSSSTMEQYNSHTQHDSDAASQSSNASRKSRDSRDGSHTELPSNGWDTVRSSHRDDIPRQRVTSPYRGRNMSRVDEEEKSHTISRNPDDWNPKIVVEDRHREPQGNKTFVTLDGVRVQKNVIKEVTKGCEIYSEYQYIYPESHDSKVVNFQGLKVILDNPDYPPTNETDIAMLEEHPDIILRVMTHNIETNKETLQYETVPIKHDNYHGTTGKWTTSARLTIFEIELDKNSKPVKVTSKNVVRIATQHKITPTMKARHEYFSNPDNRFGSAKTDGNHGITFKGDEVFIEIDPRYSTHAPQHGKKKSGVTDLISADTKNAPKFVPKILQQLKAGTITESEAKAKSSGSYVPPSRRDSASGTGGASGGTGGAYVAPGRRDRDAGDERLRKIVVQGYPDYILNGYKEEYGDDREAENQFKRDLRSMFNDCGYVEHLFLIAGGRKAIVIFSEEEEAKQAIGKMDRKAIREWGALLSVQQSDR